MGRWVGRGGVRVWALAVEWLVSRLVSFFALPMPWAGTLCVYRRLVSLVCVGLRLVSPRAAGALDGFHARLFLSPCFPPLLYPPLLLPVQCAVERHGRPRSLSYVARAVVVAAGRAPPTGVPVRTTCEGAMEGWETPPAGRKRRTFRATTVDAVDRAAAAVPGVAGQVGRLDLCVEAVLTRYFAETGRTLASALAVVDG